MADIFDTLINAGNFTTLTQAISSASLFQGLKEQGEITLFAPTDEAFSKLPSGTMGTLLDNPPELEKVLTYHIVVGKLSMQDAVNSQPLTTVEGTLVVIDRSDGNTRVNDATILTPDIQADNGIIHSIDNVLMPQSVADLFVISQSNQ